MSALNDTVGGYKIATYKYGDIITGGYYLSKGNTSTPSVLSFASDGVIRKLPVTDNVTRNFLTGGVTEEVYQSDLWTESKNMFTNTVGWIWGSLDAGGCYIRKVGNDSYTVGGVTCLAKTRADDLYYFVIQEANRTWHQSELDDLCFMYDENFILNEYPIMDVFSTGGLRRYNDYYNYYHYKLYDAFIHNYGLTHNLFSMYECTRYITWEGSLGDTPSCYWAGTNLPGVVFPYAISYTILGLMDSFYQNAVIVSGDPWGGKRNAPEDEDGDDTNENGGSSSTGGGYGGYPQNTGHNGHTNPSNDTVNICNSGFVTLYNPTLAEVKSFNTWLFSDATFTDAMANIVKRLMANPMDFVLFLALCRFTPPSTVTNTIQFCGINTNVTAKLINNQFYQLSCGTVSGIHDTNTFLDYNPKTKASIYLPYIGIRELNTDDVIGSTLSLVYNIDMMSGSCVAQLQVIRSARHDGDANIDDVIYSWQGNVYETIPLTGTDWRGMLSSMIGVGASGATLGAGIATSNPAMIAGGISGIAQSVIGDKVSVSHSGSLSGSYGYMDEQRPYIILERPINNNPKRFGEYNGYMSNIYVNLSTVEGYTEILPDTLWTQNFDGILEEEAEMLKQICSDGIYL